MFQTSRYLVIYELESGLSGRDVRAVYAYYYNVILLCATIIDRASVVFASV